MGYYDADVHKSVLERKYDLLGDLSSHGTNVVYTATRSFVSNVSFNELASGWARGGAPCARLAVYKVLLGVDARGSDASVLPAIDDTIHNGVDIISWPLGGKMEEFWASPSLHAIHRGIIIVYARGERWSSSLDGWPHFSMGHSSCG